MNAVYDIWGLFYMKITGYCPYPPLKDVLGFYTKAKENRYEPMAAAEISCSKGITDRVCYFYDADTFDCRFNRLFEPGELECFKKRIQQ